MALTLQIAFAGSVVAGKNVYLKADEETGASAWGPSLAFLIPATVTSSPAGLAVTVDNIACTTPCSLVWGAASLHTLAAATQPGVTGTQYVFANWSDTGTASHAVTAPGAAATYSVAFTTQYYLTTAATPAAGGTVTPTSAWYNAGSVVAVSASARSGYQFSGFSGALIGSASPQNATMSGPASVAAVFDSVSTITVTSAPPGRSLTVDGARCTAPCSFQWLAGSSHILVAATQAGTTGTQYTFGNWSDAGASSHTVTVPATATTYTASFTTQYQLTTAANPAGGGAILPATAWYNAGATVAVSATANSGYLFSDFSGTVSATASPQNLTMSGPATVTAGFAVATAITVASTPAGLSLAVDGVACMAPCSVQLAVGSSHTIAAATQVGATGTQYLFASWSDGGAASHSVIAPSSATTYTAVFTMQNSPLTVDTVALPSASPGAPYSTTLRASGGVPPYTWSVAPGSSLPPGLSLASSTAILTGNPGSVGSYQFTALVTDTNNTSATQALTLLVTAPVLSINGGSNLGEVPSATRVTVALTLSDQAAGASDIAWGQFYLADSGGSAYCSADWGRPNGLDLYDGNLGTTWGFGTNQSDAACTVSLVSITNSATDPSQATVILGLSFYPPHTGAFTFLSQINYSSGYAGPWQALGTLTIDPGPSVAPTTGSGYSGTFTATVVDSNGAADVSQARLLILSGTSGSLINQCVMRYDPASNNVYLLGDDGVTYLGPVPGGSDNPLTNSQCSITGAYNVQRAGNSQQVDFAVTFTTNFMGTHPVSLALLANGGAVNNSGQAGIWMVPAVNFSSGQTSGSGGPPDLILDAPVPSPPAAVNASMQACSDTSGIWEDANLMDPSHSPAVWSLTQDQFGNIFGTLSGKCTLNRATTTVEYTVHGNGSQLNATPPTESVTCEDGTQWVLNPVSVYNVNAGCSYATPSNETAGAVPVGSAAMLAQNPSSVQSWDRRTSAPQIDVVSDIYNDAINLTLSGQNKAGDVDVILSGPGFLGPIQPLIIKHDPDISPGTKNYQFGRTTLPQAVFTNMTVSWGGVSVVLNPKFAALGYTRFSQYNTPAESTCAGGQTQAYIFDNDPNTCLYSGAALKSDFIRQTDLNGTGIRADGTILKPYRITLVGKSCGLPSGGSDDSKTGNVFVAVPKVDGSCNTAFTSATTLATYPFPDSSKSTTPGVNQCGDQVLLVSGQNANDSLKTVQDACPACSGDFRGTARHIDSYTTQSACSAHAFGDYNNQPYYGFRNR